MNLRRLVKVPVALCVVFIPDEERVDLVVSFFY